MISPRTLLEGIETYTLPSLKMHLQQDRKSAIRYPQARGGVFWVWVDAFDRLPDSEERTISRILAVYWRKIDDGSLGAKEMSRLSRDVASVMRRWTMSREQMLWEGRVLLAR